MPTRQPTAPRHPQTLKAEAQARAVETYNRRVAELDALAPLLTKLEELRPALAERGCTLYTDNITLERESLVGGYGEPRHKVLRLITDSWCDKATPRRFMAALIDLGLHVVSTRPGPYGSALLRKGPLLIRVNLADTDTNSIAVPGPAPRQPAANVVHCRAGQVAATAAAHPDKTVVCTTAVDGSPLAGGYAMAPARAPVQSTLAA